MKNKDYVHRQQLQQAGPIFQLLLIIGGEPIHESVVNIFTEALLQGKHHSFQPFWASAS
jgi:hypothetical protein